MSQIFSGTVMANQKKVKTVSVEVISYHRHPKYQKVIKHKKKIEAHNEGSLLRAGEKVVIKSSRPYSKTKRFLVIKSNK